MGGENQLDTGKSCGHLCRSCGSRFWGGSKPRPRLMEGNSLRVAEAEALSAGDIAATYAVRWEVELLFKELKSQCVAVVSC